MKERRLSGEDTSFMSATFTSIIKTRETLFFCLLLVLEKDGNDRHRDR